MNDLAVNLIEYTDTERTASKQLMAVAQVKVEM
jgi:hypothetical protein